MAATVELDDRGIVVACGSCGQKNRLMYDRLGDEVRCGQCKAALALPGSPIEIRSTDDFDRLVAHAAIPVVVDYWAPWCGPCRGFAPIYDRVAEANPDVVFAKVNTDDEQEIAAHFQIRSIPTLMVFREQIIVFSQPGALPQNALEQVVARSKDLDMNEVRAELQRQEGAQDGQGAAPAA